MTGAAGAWLPKVTQQVPDGLGLVRGLRTVPSVHHSIYFELCAWL